MRDGRSNLDVAITLAPATRTASANGSTIDTQGYDTITLVVIVGSYTDGTHLGVLQHSDDGTTWSDVEAADQLGALSAIAAANQVQRVGYRGGRRYVRGRLVVSGATSGAVSAAVVLRGRPSVAPVA